MWYVRVTEITVYYVGCFKEVFATNLVVIPGNTIYVRVSYLVEIQGLHKQGLVTCVL